MTVFEAPPTILGIFVGGASKRMGGKPKGLLEAPGTGEPLLVRLYREGLKAGLETVLVGEAAPYEGLLPGVPRLVDEPRGIGPLGGLGALLGHAGDGRAIAVACDMPHVHADVLRDLAHSEDPAAVLATRAGPDAPWEPLLARYDAPRVRPALKSALEHGVRSFQRFFRELEETGLGVSEMHLSEANQASLVDWDEPADVE